MTTPTEPGIEGLLPDDGSLRPTACAPGSAVDAWRSIETPPQSKRGGASVRVLVALADGSVFFGQYTPFYLGRADEHRHLWHVENFGWATKPTHWMPLPAAPKHPDALGIGSVRNGAEGEREASKDLLLLAVEALEAARDAVETTDERRRDLAWEAIVSALSKINEARGA